MPYVNLNLDDSVELRIHGVSGTPPELMLQHPRVRKVAGNKLAGFHRREWESGASRDEDSTPVLEAYWWGGLTSGNWSRALWLLLLPFMLVNVAFYMTPTPGLERPNPQGKLSWWRVRGLSEAVQRLLALSLTFTMVLAVSGVSLDLVAWQCLRGGAGCALPSWMSFLRWEWLQSSGRPLVVMAVLPLLVVALLWWLGRSTWASTERASLDTTVESTVDIKIGARTLWDGQRRVRRLRVLHISAAFALVGLLLAVPFLPDAELRLEDLQIPAGGSEIPQWLSAVLVWTLVGILTACSLAVAFDPAPDSGSLLDRLDPGGTRWPAVLTTTVLAGVGAAAVQAAVTEPRAGGRTHPWLTEGPQALFVAQLVLLAAITVFCVVLRLRTGRRADDDVVRASGLEVPSKSAWAGLAQPVTAGIGWLMANALAAAILLRAAELLGTPEPSSSPHREGETALFLPPALFWAAAMTAAALAVGLVCAAFGYRQLRRVDLEDQVLCAYPLAGSLLQDEDVAARVQEVGGYWARARIADAIRTWVGRWMFVSLSLVAVVLVAFVVDRNWIFNHHAEVFHKAIAVGSLALTGSIAALAFLGWRAYRSDTTRRLAGILWDVGTFWPRATHPLAPPCYSERTIPDLIKRIEEVAKGGHNVYLSAHSQGAVIAAATVAALRTECAGRVAMLTYGSPVARLYARFFPAYFSTPCLLALGDHLMGTSEPLKSLVDRVGPRDRSSWPWLNLYRKSDRIGGYVLADYAAVEAPRDIVFGEDSAEIAALADAVERADKRRAHWKTAYTDKGTFTAGVYENGDIDWQLVDPQFARAAGDREFPATLGHSDYWLDPAFKEALRLLAERRTMKARARPEAEPRRTAMEPAITRDQPTGARTWPGRTS